MMNDANEQLLGYMLPYAKSIAAIDQSHSCLKTELRGLISELTN